MRKLVVVFTGIAILGFFALGVFVSAKRKALTSTRGGFTIASKGYTVIGPNGERIERTTVRYVSGTGAFHDITTLATGEKKETFFIPGQGVFHVNHRLRELIRDPRAATKISPYDSPEQLKGSREFVKEEMILGYKTYLLRIIDPKSGLPSGDIYFAFEFGKNPLKIVNYDGQGQVTSESEAYNITMGEPSQDVLALPQYPIKNP